MNKPEVRHLLADDSHETAACSKVREGRLATREANLLPNFPHVSKVKRIHTL